MKTLALLVLVAGCGGPPVTAQFDPGEQLEADKSDSSMPYGGWVAASSAGELGSLVIDKDKSFDRVFQTTEYDGVEQTGHVKFTGSSTSHYIRFYDAAGNFLDRLAWKMSNKVLTLTDQYGNVAKLDAHPACRAAGDCSGPLPKLCRVCSDGTTSCAHWSCEAELCTLSTCN